MADINTVEGLHLSLLVKELTPVKSAKDLGVILHPNLTIYKPKTIYKQKPF